MIRVVIAEDHTLIREALAKMLIASHRIDVVGQAATGTEVADGAIRWSSELAVGETVRIVVHTAGAEIPFRIEVVGGPGGV